MKALSSAPRCKVDTGKYKDNASQVIDQERFLQKDWGQKSA